MRKPHRSSSITKPTSYSKHRFSAWLCGFILSINFVAGGATCARRQTIPEFAPPIVFKEPPSLAQISEQLNRSLAIERLESNSVTITSPNIPVKLAGNLAWERPHNFSLQAYNGARVFGKAFSAGSNSQEFWLEWDQNLFYANHNDFENQLGPRPILPVSPLWLREALGVVELDPTMQHSGPTMRPDGKVQIESRIPSPRGFYTRVVVLDAATAAIVETRLYNQDLKEVAQAQQSNHQFYSAVGLSLPHTVNITLQPDEGEKLAFTVDLEFYLVNEPASTDVNAFTRPDSSGLSTRNLVQASTNMVPGTLTPPVYTQTRPVSEQSTLENYRVVR